MPDLLPGLAGFRQLVEWGYPQGTLRPVPSADKAFSTIHITGNSSLPSAQNELAWRINDLANQNSATFFVNRDGTIWQALGDPLRMDPWANGDVNGPDTSNPRIAALVRDDVNANQRTLVAIENVGFEPGASITDAQVQADAAIIRYYHDKAGVPISRETVCGHYQLNAVSRPNCPAVDKRVIDRIVAYARPSTAPTREERLGTEIEGWRRTHPLEAAAWEQGTGMAANYTGPLTREMRLAAAKMQWTALDPGAVAQWESDSGLTQALDGQPLPREVRLATQALYLRRKTA